MCLQDLQWFPEDSKFLAAPQPHILVSFPSECCIYSASSPGFSLPLPLLCPELQRGKGKGILVAEQRRRKDRIKHAVRGQSLPVFSCSPASQSLKSRGIAPPALSAAFCLCLKDGAMGKLHVRKSQAETRNGMRDLLAPELKYIYHL